MVPIALFLSSVSRCYGAFVIRDSYLSCIPALCCSLFTFLRHLTPYNYCSPDEKLYVCETLIVFSFFFSFKLCYRCGLRPWNSQSWQSNSQDWKHLNVSLLSIWMTGSVLQECPKTESSLFPCTVLELWQRCFGLSIACDSKCSQPLLANLHECSVCANIFCSTYEPLGGTINYYTDVFSSVTYPVLGFLVDCLRIEDTCWVFFLSKVKLT